MGRKKKCGESMVLVTARVPVSLVQKADDAGRNKSEIVRRAFRDSLSLGAEKEYIREMMDFHYGEYERYGKRLDELERVEEKVRCEDDLLWAECKERLYQRYVHYNFIDDEVKMVWARKLGVSVDVISRFVESEII